MVIEDTLISGEEEGKSRFVMMEGKRHACVWSRTEDIPWEYVFAKLDNSRDRSIVSEVCREWKRVDSLCRKEVKIDNCSSIVPSALTRRFPHLVSVRIHALNCLYNMYMEPFKPWITELGRGYRQKIKKISLRRMCVTDAYLEEMVEAFSDSLDTLELYKCFGGFSTRGLCRITSSCRFLKVLNMEASRIEPSESGGQWLRELALTNHHLEYLNFKYVESLDFDINNLETLVNNCRSLRSLKVNQNMKLKDMLQFLTRATGLMELGTGPCFNRQENDENPLITAKFPTSIVALSGLYGLTDFPPICQSGLLARLKFINFDHPYLTQEGFITILGYCVGLETLKLKGTTKLGDEGLMAVAGTCRDLKRIDVFGIGSAITPGGIIPLVQSCIKLEHLDMNVKDINNATLTAVSNHCPFMKKCSFVLKDSLDFNERPLDEGVRDLLIGCQHLYKFGLAVEKGCLTNMGMAYIGKYGSNLQWIMLRCTGESDEGFRMLATGCRSLQKLVLTNSLVSERELASAAINIRNLKRIWASGPNVTNGGGQILTRSRSNWVNNVKTYSNISASQQNRPGKITAYRSLNSINILVLD